MLSFQIKTTHPVSIPNHQLKGWSRRSKEGAEGAEVHLEICGGQPAGMAMMVIDNSGRVVPSGKHLHSYGKSPCLMGKSTISTGPFSIAMLNYQRVNQA